MSIHPKNPILKNPFLFVTFAYFFFQALPVDITTQPIVQTSQEKAPVVAEMFLPSNKPPFIMPKKTEVVHLGETEEILY